MHTHSRLQETDRMITAAKKRMALIFFIRMIDLQIEVAKIQLNSEKPLLGGKKVVFLPRKVAGVVERGRLEIC